MLRPSDYMPALHLRNCSTQCLLLCVVHRLQYDGDASVLQAIRYVANDAVILGTFNTWLNDLLSEQSSVNEHLLLKLLEALKALPSRVGVLKASGLAAAVRNKALEHRSKAVRALAEQLMQVRRCHRVLSL